LIEVIPVKVSADIKPKDDLAAIIIKAASKAEIRDGDIIVVAQKIVSKAEGRVVDLGGVKPSKKATKMAKEYGKDSKVMEIILQESAKIVKAKNGIIISETKHGFVCANAGVDQSNAKGDVAVLLPIDPDKSASRLRDAIKKKADKDVAIIITDTFGRPFRNGQTNVAIGVAGINPIKSYIGSKDMYGKTLRVTEIAVADEIASAAELVMGKSEGIPVAIVRGYKFERVAKPSTRSLLRSRKKDLFRQ
jgi:coenzyme F420-0:L-glutamate ligase/coenzyme F420-1:gamma-L-glutamate ligase